jgi:hypothetical protein
MKGTSVHFLQLGTQWKQVVSLKAGSFRTEKQAAAKQWIER